jgi:hypothetical protein
VSQLLLLRVQSDILENQSKTAMNKNSIELQIAILPRQLHQITITFLMLLEIVNLITFKVVPCCSITGIDI